MKKGDMQGDEGNQCCGMCFKFDLVDVTQISDLTFYSAGGSVIIVTYVKDGQLYISLSFDCGQHFLKPIRVLEVLGIIKYLQILAKENQFVIVLLVHDTKTNKNIKQAVSGQINKGELNFNWKECVRHEVKGNVINISAGFRPSRNPATGQIDSEESVDFSYYFNEEGEVCLECNGHRCLVT